jgi:hypothetical protein
MVGGLLLSQALTLYTTPVIYIFFDTLGDRFSRWRGGNGARKADKENPTQESSGPAQPAEQS